MGDATPQLIALTGYRQPKDRDRSERAGFHSHFVKPVDIQMLAQAIADADRRATAERPGAAASRE
jgi:CheY-like chemotaxis protein